MGTNGQSRQVSRAETIKLRELSINMPCILATTMYTWIQTITPKQYQIRGPNRQPTVILKQLGRNNMNNRHENTRWRAASEQYNLLLVTAIVKIYCPHNVLCSISSSSYYSRLKWPTSYLFASSVRQGVTNMSQYIMLKKLIISSATIIMAVDSDSGCT